MALVINPLPHSLVILISSNLVPILDADPRNKSTSFSRRKNKKEPTAKVKLAAKYPNTNTDWKCSFVFVLH